ncbi:hypothetical protein QYE76_003265 [Lolium multiflorum]|uniref:Uncharacterized protein n=1 Tax=Lolium multiflorum TaxID=4521 RepID=A0AAD8VYP0_LOLMU|nr:hypothetical protein QYE76_003265 [Lolium multiflorum]
MATQDLEFSEWERSKISNQDTNLMKKLGLMKKKETLIFPSEESFPTPPIEYRVSFVDHLIHGLSAPIHEFLRGLLFVYGLQLHQNHQVTPSLPPLPEGGEVEDRAIVAGDAQGTSRPESETAASQKSAASSERENESEDSESVHSLPSAASPRNKRKRGNVEDSGTSKAGESPAEETSPEEEDAFNPYTNALVSSSFRNSPCNGGNLASSARLRGVDSCRQPPCPITEESEDLAQANKRADDLALKLEQSEKSREKAELDAASIESLRKRLHEAETALSDKTAQQIAREEDVIARLESQNRRFVRKMSQDFELAKPADDRLLNALSLLEIHGDLVCRTISDAKMAFSRLFPYFFPKKEQPDTFAALTKHFIPKKILV